MRYIVDQFVQKEISMTGQQLSFGRLDIRTAPFTRPDRTSDDSL